jgi:hypothetical protein
MKRIRQTTKNNWIDLIKKIRERFGDKNLFFSFSPFKKGKLISRNQYTFAHDNIGHIENWCVLMQTKIVSSRIDVIVMILRIFLPDKVTVDIPNGKIEIPRKDIYHFSFVANEIVLFDELETYESQNTDALTGLPLEHEQGLVYRSSIELYDSIYRGNDENEK